MEATFEGSDQKAIGRVIKRLMEKEKGKRRGGC